MLLDNTIINLASTNSILVEKTKNLLEEPTIKIDKLRETDIIILSTSAKSGKTKALDNVEFTLDE